jgi:hypothetical protein
MASTLLLSIVSYNPKIILFGDFSAHFDPAIQKHAMLETACQAEYKIWPDRPLTIHVPMYQKE